MEEVLGVATLAVPFMFGLLAHRGHRWFAAAGLAPGLTFTVWSLVAYSGDSNLAAIWVFFIGLGLLFWAAWSAAVGAGFLLRRFLDRSR